MDPKEYVCRSVATNMERPPRSEFGKGYLCALIAFGEECLGMTDKDWLSDMKEARRLIAEGTGGFLQEEGITAHITVRSRH